MSALQHYNNIVDGIFGGDAKKMVFGFRISDCSGTGSNASTQQASRVMTDLAAAHPCNGGAFFWVVEHDTGGSWSSSVGSTIQRLGAANCRSGPAPTRPQPTPVSPVAPPPSPVTSPVAHAVLLDIQVSGHGTTVCSFIIVLVE